MDKKVAKVVVSLAKAGHIDEALEVATHTTKKARMVSMTFGEMPSWNEFLKHFRHEVRQDTYNVTAGLHGEPRLQWAMDKAGIDGDVSDHGASHDFTAKELFKVVNILKDDRHEEGEMLASSIMETLGFEWI